MFYRLIHSKSYGNFLVLFILSLAYSAVFIWKTSLTGYSIAAFLINTTLAFAWYFMVDNYKLLKTSTFTPAYVFLAVIWWGDFIEPNFQLKWIAAMFLFLKFRMLQLTQSSYHYFKLTDIGLILGIWMLLDVTLSVFLLYALAGIISLRKSEWRNIAIPLFGVFIPFLYYAVFLFINDSLQIQDFIHHLLSYNKPLALITSSNIFTVGLLALYLLIGAIPLMKELQHNILLKRKILNLNFLGILLVIPVYFFTRNLALAYTLLAITFSLYISPFFYSLKRKNLSVILLIIWILSPFGFLFFP